MSMRAGRTASSPFVADALALSSRHGRVRQAPRRHRSKQPFNPRKRPSTRSSRRSRREHGRDRRGARPEGRKSCKLRR